MYMNKTPNMVGVLKKCVTKYPMDLSFEHVFKKLMTHSYWNIYFINIYEL
jgi:hypothetical protein